MLLLNTVSIIQQRVKKISLILIYGVDLYISAKLVNNLSGSSENSDIEGPKIYHK
jgi:hypothetical protein